MFPVRCIMGPLIQQLVVPLDPVVTSAGHDVILPCHLSPQTSAVAMAIRWFKVGEFANPLYLYLGGKVTEGKGYEGRVSMFNQELEKGNISLLLNNVMASERGSYTCHASYLDWIQELPVVLQVKQQGSVPRISMRKHHRVFIQLSCSSENWYPAPDMLWTDRSGKEITSAETERPKQKDEGVLYSITMDVTFDPDTAHLRLSLSDDNKCLKFGELKEKKDCENFKEKGKGKPKDTERFGGKPTEKSMLNVSGKDKDKNIGIFNWKKQKGSNKESTLKVEEVRKEEATENLEEKCKGTKNKFNQNPCVLGMEGYDKGTCYWEVDLGKKIQWSVGIAQDTEKRDNIQMYPENGFWSICYKDGELKTVEQSSTFLPIELKPEKLGVLVDYEGGQITFVNVEKRCHIHSFTGTFTKKLYPFFGPLIDCKEELKISPVVQRQTLNLRELLV
uniref:Ig-like domain-containing protein n=1 Tax=Hucho hucho TaxID=62062 RepID=A0A4W5N497_9TELE